MAIIGLESMTITAGTWQQAGGHGAGAVAESLLVHKQKAERERGITNRE